MRTKWAVEARKEISEKLEQIRKNCAAARRALHELEKYRAERLEEAEELAKQFIREKNPHRRDFARTTTQLEAVNTAVFLLNSRLQDAEADESDSCSESDVENHEKEQNTEVGACSGGPPPFNIKEEPGTSGDKSPPGYVSQGESPPEEARSPPNIPAESLIPQPSVQAPPPTIDNPGHAPEAPGKDKDTINHIDSELRRESLERSEKRSNPDRATAASSPGKELNVVSPEPQCIGEASCPSPEPPLVNKQKAKSKDIIPEMEENKEMTQPTTTGGAGGEEAVDMGPVVDKLELDPGKNYEVIVQHMTSPWLLWVQPGSSSELDDLIDSMEYHYKALEEQPPPEHLTVGMTVAACSSVYNLWYRGRVTACYELNENKLARIFFIDVGNLELVEYQNIRPLEAKFSQLPAHAIPCALDGICPPNRSPTWPESSSKYLLLIIHNSQGTTFDVSFTQVPDCPVWFTGLHVQQTPPHIPVQSRSGPVATELLHINKVMTDHQKAQRMRREDIARAITPESLGIEEPKLKPGTVLVSHVMDFMDILRSQSPRQIGLNVPNTPDNTAKKSCPEPKKVWERVLNHYLPSDSKPPRQKTSKVKKETASSPVSNPSGKSINIETAGQKGPGDPSHSKTEKSKKRSGQSGEHAKEQKPKIPQPSTPTPSKSSSSKSSKTPKALTSYQSMRFPPQVVELEEIRFGFLISYTVSPFDFFIHIVDEQTSNWYNWLFRRLKNYAQECNLPALQNLVKLPLEVHDACVAKYIENDEVGYYRAEILEVLKPAKQTASAASDSQCRFKVHYVDFGNQAVVKQEDVFPLQPKIAGIPAQAVRCKLAGIKPKERKMEGVDRSDEKNISDWSTNPDQEFYGYIHDYIPGTTLRPSLSEPLELVVFMWDGVEEVNINMEMVKQGLAQLSGDVLTSMGADAGQTTAVASEPVASGSVATGAVASGPVASGPVAGGPVAGGPVAGGAVDQTGDKEKIAKWDPMMDDYFSIRNNYDVDVHDAGVALTGYKSVGDESICRFFSAGKVCWKAEHCPYKHIKPGTDMTEKRSIVCATHGENRLLLPTEGDMVMLEVVSMITPAHFYVHFPYGPTENLAEIQSPASPAPLQELKRLRFEMTNYYEEHLFEHQDLTVYAKSEMVAIKCDKDGYWYRACVLQPYPDRQEIKCKLVDYGVNDVVHERKVKQLLERFVQLPFQVVECFLSMEPIDGYWTKESFLRFKKYVNGRQLMAKVLYRNMVGTLHVDIYSDEVSVTDSFIEDGLARRAEIYQVIPTQDQKVLMGPG